ncbi:MAG: DUF2235 domain-containing protein [Marinobacter sp.]|nr:DUF2235 domain-containing protein [Marinobacter sp.]
MDIFGFSRGAATARHFVNEVQDGVGGALGQAFQEQGIAWPKNVTIRFLGLFDTVAAVVDVRSGDFSAHNANNGDVRVNIAADAVQTSRTPDRPGRMALQLLPQQPARAGWPPAGSF